MLQRQWIKWVIFLPFFMLVNLIEMATTTVNYLHSARLCPSVKGIADTSTTTMNGAGVVSMPQFFSPMMLTLILTTCGVKGTNTSESNQYH